MFKLLNSNKRYVCTLIRNQNMFEFNEIFSEISVILNEVLFLCACYEQQLGATQ